MPEGPEVLAISRRLASIRGKVISIKPNIGPAIVTSATVLNVATKGKLIYITLNNGRAILNHMGMTGEWSNEPGPYTRYTLEYSAGHKKYFNDPRKLGKLEYVSMAELHARLNAMGPDVLSPSFTLSKFRDQLTNRGNSLVANIIMDQSVIAGIGNYLRSEILWEAKIGPATLVKNTDLSILYRAIVKITRKSAAAGGYLGTYRPKIYGCKKDPNGRPIHMATVGGRTLYFVK